LEALASLRHEAGEAFRFAALDRGGRAQGRRAGAMSAMSAMSAIVAYDIYLVR
jgi:hypothetical protein